MPFARNQLDWCVRQQPSTDPRTGPCYWCGQIGHFWRDKLKKTKCTNKQNVDNDRKRAAEAKEGKEGNARAEAEALVRSVVEAQAATAVNQRQSFAAVAASDNSAQRIKELENKIQQQEQRHQAEIADVKAKITQQQQSLGDLERELKESKDLIKQLQQQQRQQEERQLQHEKKVKLDLEYNLTTVHMIQSDCIAVEEELTKEMKKFATRKDLDVVKGLLQTKSKADSSGSLASPPPASQTDTEFMQRLFGWASSPAERKKEKSAEKETNSNAKSSKRGSATANHPSTESAKASEVVTTQQASTQTQTQQAEKSTEEREEKEAKDETKSPQPASATGKTQQTSARQTQTQQTEKGAEGTQQSTPQSQLKTKPDQSAGRILPAEGEAKGDGEDSKAGRVLRSASRGGRR